MNAKRTGKPVAVLFATTPASSFATALTQGDATGSSPDRLAGIQKPSPYSRNADSNFPERPLFGGTHQQIAGSMDAGGAGACRFANGEGVRARPEKGSGFRARTSTNLQRPN